MAERENLVYSNMVLKMQVGALLGLCTRDQLQEMVRRLRSEDFKKTVIDELGLVRWLTAKRAMEEAVSGIESYLSED